MKGRGFTLIELLVVISIIAVLSSVVVASLNAARDKGRLGAAKYFAAQVDHVAGDSAAGVWDFDECSGTGVTDRSGNGSSGSFNGSPSFQVDTPIGTGCSIFFSGSGQYVTVASSSVLDMGGSSFTISLWIKKTTTGTGMIFEHSIWPATDTYQIENTGTGAIRLNFPALNGAEGPLDYLGNVSDSKWHNIVGVLDSQKQVASLYIDGVLAVNKTVIETTSSGTSATYIGARGNNTLAFPGYIDMVRVYKKALTASEVGERYALGIKRFALLSKRVGI